MITCFQLNEPPFRWLATSKAPYIFYCPYYIFINQFFILSIFLNYMWYFHPFFNMDIRTEQRPVFAWVSNAYFSFIILWMIIIFRLCVRILTLVSFLAFLRIMECILRVYIRTRLLRIFANCGIPSLILLTIMEVNAVKIFTTMKISALCYFICWIIKRDFFILWLCNCYRYFLSFFICITRYSHLSSLLNKKE